MIADFGKLSTNILFFVIYADSDSLATFVKDRLKERFNVDRRFIIDVATSKQLHEAKLESFMRPLSGGKKMFNINADKMSKKDITNAFTIASSFSLTVLWTAKYGTYKQIVDSKEFKNLGSYAHCEYFGKLYEKDIRYLHKRMVLDNNRPGLSSQLLNLLGKAYTYDVQGICDLFMMMKSGTDVESKKDIVELIGVGGNTVDKFTLNLLMANPKTARGKKQTLSKYLRQLEDLSYSYKWASIKNFMLNTVSGFIEMKQLQIMGLYRNIKVTIPEGFDEKRINRLRRYDWAVMDKISLSRCLTLKLLLEKNNNFDVRMALTQTILEYVDSLLEVGQ